MARRSSIDSATTPGSDDADSDAPVDGFDPAQASDLDLRSAAKLRTTQRYDRLVESDEPGTDDAAARVRRAEPVGTQAGLAAQLVDELLEDTDDGQPWAGVEPDPDGDVPGFDPAEPPSGRGGGSTEVRARKLYQQLAEAGAEGDEEAAAAAAWVRQTAKGHRALDRAQRAVKRLFGGGGP